MICIYDIAVQSCIHAGCPRIIRSDNGTENALIAPVQMALRNSHTDDVAGRLIISIWKVHIQHSTFVTPRGIRDAICQRQLPGTRGFLIALSHDLS